MLDIIAVVIEKHTFGRMYTPLMTGEVSLTAWNLTKQYATKESLPAIEPIRKRNTQKHDVSRIVRLEGKLDSIVSLLHSVTQPQPGASSPTLHLDLGTGNDSPGQLQIREPFLNAVPSISPPGSSFSGLGTSDLPGTSVHPIIDLHPSEADDCLGLFRTQMLKFFAFIHLPDQLPAKQLQQERPFLFLCIMAATTRSTENKHFCRREMDAQPKYVIRFGIRSVANALGGQDQLLNNTPTSLSRFTSFAMTLVFDLRLNKPPPKDSNMLPTLKPQEILTVTMNTTRNLDERRAVTEIDISRVSSYFGQIDALLVGQALCTSSAPTAIISASVGGRARL
ncbi:hypothetical protein BDZ45DRAFT_741674 [Acephala macrosclerotiorum]|nr:hypothetical protein BDZ45DRAFT_741674 [Acephala macrosclerotiorum]